MRLASPRHSMLEMGPEMKQSFFRGVATAGALLVLGLPVAAGLGMNWTAAVAQEGEPPVVELARRLLAPGAPDSVAFLTGSLPSDLPLALPLPDNARVIGTLVQNRGNGVMVNTVVVDAPYGPSDVGTYYEQRLPSMGWNAPPPAQDLAPGFFCQAAEGPFIKVSAYPLGESASDVRVDVVTGNGGPCAGPPPTAQPSGQGAPAQGSPPQGQRTPPSR
jgi:hypothetical protein